MSILSLKDKLTFFSVLDPLKCKISWFLFLLIIFIFGLVSFPCYIIGCVCCSLAQNFYFYEIHIEGIMLFKDRLASFVQLHFFSVGLSNSSKKKTFASYFAILYPYLVLL